MIGQRTTRTLRSILLFATTISMFSSVAQAGTWQPLTNQFPNTNVVDGGGNILGPGGAAAPLLMTDGSVLVFDVGYWGSNGRVFKLTPDQFGSYVNGTWTEVAPIPYAPIGASQAVLADGRVIIEGGEYTSLYYFTLTNQGAIYDPVANSWTSVPPPSEFVDLYPPRAAFAPRPIGDAANVVLANGRFMLDDKMSRQQAILNLTKLKWEFVGASTKSDMNDEEGWTLLPDGKVLTVDCYTDYYFGILPPPYPSNPTNSEIFDPVAKTWSSAGSTINTLTDQNLSEIGPALLRPNGTVFIVGSQGYTSIYDSRTQTWSVGPQLPISPQGYQYTAQDAPGVLLPSGNVLFAASGGQSVSGGYSNPPAAFFEFDGTNLNPEPTIPNATGDQSGSISLLPLPNGQVLSVDSTNDVEIYTPTPRKPVLVWAPVILSAPTTVTPSQSYTAHGTRFNGWSQACSFGDEQQCATNYPLVRITNLATGHVFYSRTHDHTSMAVASSKTVATTFDVPAGQESGASTLQVVANGIASTPWSVMVNSVPGARPVAGSRRSSPGETNSSATAAGTRTPIHRNPTHRHRA
jgi:hypothetical protein